MNKKLLAALGALGFGGLAAFAEDGSGSGAAFLPSAVTQKIGSAITSAKTDLVSVITDNFDNILLIVGAFLAIALVWWLVKIVKRALSKG